MTGDDVIAFAGLSSVVGLVAFYAVRAKLSQIPANATTPSVLFTPPPRTEVYLLQFRWFRFLYNRAELEVTATTVRCTPKEYGRWMQKRSGIPDLKTRLKAGEAVAVFEFVRGTYTVKWDSLGSICRIGLPGAARWTLSFQDPGGTAWAALGNMMFSKRQRDVLSQWGYALNPWPYPYPPSGYPQQPNL